MEFKILRKSKKSNARLGLLKTKHGVVKTPSLVSVATQGIIKTLDSREILETGSQISICNTFHLHLKPGEDIVQESGGLHKFMNHFTPLMTDSGGFQVFSLGFGRDQNISKVLKGNPGHIEIVRKGQQPRSLKIGQDGVHFRSPVDGRKLFLGPRESIRIQEKLGADIIFAFDECPSPLASKEYVEKSLERTHSWAESCLRAKKSKQALFGIVQGGRYKDLRQKSARFISKLPFDGFGIGGEFGSNKGDMQKMIKWVIKELPEEKPRHLLGIGYLEDLRIIIKEGVDLFDCTVPTHYARHGIAFTSEGKLNMSQIRFLKERTPLDGKCGCYVCKSYKRNYICHLIKAKEITGLKLLTFHNLYFFNKAVEKIRQEIKSGKI